MVKKLRRRSRAGRKMRMIGMIGMMIQTKEERKKRRNMATSLSLYHHFDLEEREQAGGEVPP